MKIGVEYYSGMVNFRRTQLSVAQRMVRPVIGLVVIISLLLSVFPETMAMAQVSPARVDAICQLETTMSDAAADHVDCGLLGTHSGCISHSGCQAITMATAHFAFAPLSSQQWTPSKAGELSTWSQPLGTPPPILPA